MNQAHENPNLELDSDKRESGSTTYDDVADVDKTSYETCSREAVKKGQALADLDNGCQREMDFLRRMLFLMSAVVVVALLTAAAALFLATMSAMKGKHIYLLL